MDTLKEQPDPHIESWLWPSEIIKSSQTLAKYMVRHLSILDTDAIPNFIIESRLPAEIRAQVRQEPVIDIVHANNKRSKTAGIVSLVMRIGSCVVQLEFIACKTLAAPVILGCDFCDF